MMNDNILMKIIPNLNIFNDDYKQFIIKKYNKFIQTSEIPNECFGFYDTNIIFPKLQNVYDKIYTAVNDRYSMLFCMKSYNFTNYLSYMFINKYFKDCIENNLFLEDVLYIDTRLLLEDYKRLMDKSQSLIHSYYTLTENIERAALVIWDKVSLISSTYDRNKLIDIITIRKRKGLANFYFIKKEDLDPKILGTELSNCIKSDVSLGFECQNYNYDIFPIQEDSNDR